MDKKDLVRMAKAGEAGAFARLYEEIYKDLYRFALYALGTVQDAEDAVSEAVIDGFAGIAGLRNEDAFRGWMFRILSVKCRQRLKQYVTEQMEEIPEELSVQEKDLSEGMDVRRAFFRLDEEERMILALHLFSGYRTREIAGLLHMNHSTVRSRERRALKKMENFLNE